MTTEEFLAEYPPCSCLNRSSNTKYVRQKEGQARSDPFTNQRSIAWIFISYNSSLFCKCCVQKILHTQTDCALVFVCFFLSCFFFSQLASRCYACQVDFYIDIEERIAWSCACNQAISTQHFSLLCWHRSPNHIPQVSRRSPICEKSINIRRLCSRPLLLLI